jgi:hypothetical protein
MYDLMNGGTIWGMGSMWFLICMFMVLGAAALLAYFLFFSRRE